MPTRKGRKAAARLAARIKAFEQLGNKPGYKRPGSYKK